MQVDDKSQLETQAGDGGGSDDDQEMPPPPDGGQHQGPPEEQPADMPEQVPSDLQRNTVKPSSTLGALRADCSWENFRSSLLTSPRPTSRSSICALKCWRPPPQHPVLRAELQEQPTDTTSSDRGWHEFNECNNPLSAEEFHITAILHVM